MLPSEATNISSEVITENHYDIIKDSAPLTPAEVSDRVHFLGPGTNLLSGAFFFLVIVMAIIIEASREFSSKKTLTDMLEYKVIALVKQRYLGNICRNKLNKGSILRRQNI